MRKVKIICIGKLKESWWQNAFTEYEKRLSGFCSFELCELNEVRLPEDPSEKEINAALNKEASDILSRIKPGDRVVALCIEGKGMSSEEFSRMIIKESSVAGALVFIIGSSCGMAKAVKDRADIKLSFSGMTFPHQMMRVILAEQIYRGFTISENRKYHK
ncbi:MAG: 23S rRNA (pseudouridine(1915)-N(3))-methyltransferase RlmH [Clostridiales bacterium]|nr:23S rRNA (pseudouridine(1915)-N(3))-methyltransferase RlmH [Clostridiales bacterium]